MIIPTHKSLIVTEASRMLIAIATINKKVSIKVTLYIIITGIISIEGDLPAVTGSTVFGVITGKL